jgi:hypothetical protein
LLGPVGLDVPMARIVSEVLSHRFIGVKAHLTEMKAARLLLSQGQQPGPYAASLGRWQHGHILEQQVTGLGDKDDEADKLTTPDCHPGPAVADSLRIVGGHRGRELVHPGHVGFVSHRRDHLEPSYVGAVGDPEGDHLPTVGQVRGIASSILGRPIFAVSHVHNLAWSQSEVAAT